MGVFRVLGIFFYQLPPTPTYQGSVILQHFSVDAFVHPAAVVQQPPQHATCITYRGILSIQNI